MVPNFCGHLTALERGVLCANTDDTAHAITTGVASTLLVLLSRPGTSAFCRALFFSFGFFRWQIRFVAR